MSFQIMKRTLNLFGKRIVDQASKPQIVQKRRLSVKAMIDRLQKYAPGVKAKRESIGDIYAQMMTSLKKKRNSCVEALSEFYSTAHPQKVAQSNTRTNLYFA